MGKMKELSSVVNWNELYDPMEKAYIIANSKETRWDFLNCNRNPEDPPLKIALKSRWFRRNVKDVARYLDLGIILEEISPEFEANYVQAFLGVLDGWKLTGVKFYDWGSLVLLFINDDQGRSELLFLKCSPKFYIEIERTEEAGQVVKYTIKPVKSIVERFTITQFALGGAISKI